MRRAFGWAAVCAGFLCLYAVAADEKKDTDTPKLDDRAFVMKVSQDNLAEMNVGMLAARQANSDDVRKFGQRLVDDHRKANDQLNQLANRKGWPVASEMGPKHREMMERMTRLRGGDFDRHFAEHMVTDHKKAVALFEAKEKDAQDQDLKAWVTKTLPALKEHLQMSEDLAKKFGGDKTETGTKPERKDK